MNVQFVIYQRPVRYFLLNAFYSFILTKSYGCPREEPPKNKTLADNNRFFCIPRYGLRKAHTPFENLNGSRLIFTKVIGNLIIHIGKEISREEHVLLNFTPHWMLICKLITLIKKIITIFKLISQKLISGLSLTDA